MAGLDRVERHYLLHVKWLSQVTRHLLPCPLSDPNHAGSVVEKLRSREEELLIRAQRYLLLLWLNRLHLKLQSTAALRTENHLLMVACCLLRVRPMLACVFVGGEHATFLHVLSSGLTTRHLLALEELTHHLLRMSGIQALLVAQIAL